MKKILIILSAMILTLAGCSNNEGETSSSEATVVGGEKSYEVTANGYGGEMVLNVTVDGETIKGIELVSDKETAPVFDRAFPVITKRILDAQSPIVDSVSGATMSSYAVKTAVADAMKQNGKDFGAITMVTAPERAEAKQLDDLQTDIVIVGAGPAGLAAAISAKESGVENVTLIEKLDILSGNGKFDMNFFDLYTSQAMDTAGTTMTKEAFIESKSTSTDSPERIEVWAETALTLDAWLRTMDVTLNYAYGSTGHMAEADQYAGDHIQQGLEKKAIAVGVDIITGTKGTDLIIEDGKTTGVKVENRDGYYNINADAVIVATGGFSHNKELLAQYAPGAETVATSNQMGATGDFVPVFESHDLQLENMDKLSVFKLIIKNRRDLTGAGDGFLLVNETGERFIAENKSGLEMAHAILEQPNGKVFYIYDQNLFDSAYRLKKHNDLGYHVKADTLEELAEKLGIDPTNLVASVDTFNKAINGEGTDPLRETPFDRPLTSEGPYYGVQVESAIHMTKGGVLANEKAQILNTANEPVEGLYAAGEVTSTTGAYSAAVVFGKVSGTEAAAFVMAE